MISAYFEISPLFEKHWTGIPIVTAELARCALADKTTEWIFLYENIVIEKFMVQELLARRDGGHSLSYLERQLWDGKSLAPTNMRSAPCIFPNVKAVRGCFKKEAMIIHDFSTLLTPEFHEPDTIAHHANRIRGDIETTDFFFCASRATMTDLQAYFAISSSAATVLPLGVTIDPCSLSSISERRSEDHQEPYICVLGTIEPRKNGRIVLDLIKEFPEIVNRYKFVFIGRDGWKNQKDVLLSQLRDMNVDVGRIIFTGFVSEDVKLRLLLGAKFCIYPSFFEGFGIPVAEAAVLGKFVVCSNTSSLTEVAPDMCFFFEPSDALALADAFFKAEKASQLARLDRLNFNDLWARVSARNWNNAYELMRNWVGEEGLT